MKKVIVIDFGLGNIFSVLQACEACGVTAKVSSDSDEIKNCDGIILPGVGAFHMAIENLKAQNLDQVIIEAVKSGKKIFGICLGLQLLFEKSYEFGEHRGLGLIEGEIVRFPEKNQSNERIKVPNIGWHEVKKAGIDWKTTALAEIPNPSSMYFVHSFYAKPREQKVILTTTNYCGQEYCSSIMQGNIFAVQFHPEKSAEKGLSIYRNWLKSL